MPPSIVDNFVGHLQHVEWLLATYAAIVSRPVSVELDYDNDALLTEVKLAVATFAAFVAESVRVYLRDVADGLQDHVDHLSSLELPQSERYRPT